MIISLFCFLTLLISATVSIPFSHVYSWHEEPIIFGEPKPPHYFKKFVGYGYNPKIETEIRGTVIGVDAFIYIVPDPSYYNLLLPGNYLDPTCEFFDTNAGKVLKLDLLGLIFKTEAPCPRMENPEGEAFNELKKTYQEMGKKLKSLNELGFPLTFPKLLINSKLADIVNSAQQFIPIIKLERPSHKYISDKCYPEGYPEGERKISNSWFPNDQWPELPCTNPVYYPPLDPTKSGCQVPGGSGAGNENCVREGDRIIVKGFYVHEHQHAMWEPEDLGGSSCIKSLSWKENGLMACWGHAELHPYNLTHVKRISSNVSENLNPDGSYTESHTVVAPLYKAYYSQTYHPNKLYHYPNGDAWTNPNAVKVIPAGKLVDSQKQMSMNHNFFISAPPKPEECKNNDNCRLSVSVKTQSNSNIFNPLSDKTQKNGKITTTVDYERNGVNVNMFASALTVKDPIVLKGEFTLKWISASADEYLTKLTLNPVNTAKVGIPDGVAITGKLEVCNNKNRY
ncbi:hypothetical protein [Candidatus Nitrosocosmicus sp. T]